MFNDLSSSLSAAAGDPSPAYERFRLATSAGNEAYSEGAHGRALAHFEDALALARRLFQHAAQGQGCPRRAAGALLLARQNAAQNLSRLGRLEEAGAHLEAACRTLSAWRASPHAPARLCTACEGLLPRALEACVAHLERCGAGAERILALYEETVPSDRRSA